MKQRLGSERGATAVLIAFSMVGLLAFGGLVMDGGNAFSQRRQMQNAADSSATAGANALYRYKAGEPGATAADVYDDALAESLANGAKAGTFTCELVLYNPAGNEVGTADCQGATDAQLDSAWKVRVNVDSDHATQLVRVVGISSFNARADAAAALRRAVPSSGSAPFLVCGAEGVPDATGNVNPPLLLPDASDPTGFRINPNAIGTTRDIWGNDIKDDGRNCGQPQPESFRGVAEEGEFALPGWWGIDTGNRAGNEVSPLAGGCLADVQIHNILPGCQFAVPICVSGNGEPGTNFELYCVTYGRFEITKNDNGQPDMEAMFLGGGLLTSGDSGGIPSPGETAIIKLSE